MTSQNLTLGMSLDESFKQVQQTLATENFKITTVTPNSSITSEGGRNFGWPIMIVCILLFWPAAIAYYFMSSKNAIAATFTGSDGGTGSVVSITANGKKAEVILQHLTVILKGNIGITVEPKPAVISSTDDSDDKDDSDERNSNTQSEEICSHCYHEEKLHNIDLSQKDVNPNLLNSAGRACIGCKEDKLAELCHSFSSALKGSENKETRLEESKIQVEEAERKLEEKKKRKEESRNKMGREEKLQESKRQVEEAKRKLVETKRRKEESRNNRDTDKQIAKNEEEIRRIEEEIRKLDEED